MPERRCAGVHGGVRDRDRRRDRGRPLATAAARSVDDLTIIAKTFERPRNARAHGVLLTVYDQQFSCLHAQPKFDSRYQAFRQDVGPDLAYLSRKWT